MSADTTDGNQHPPKPKVPGRPFVKGQSGNPAGRPKGSRHKLEKEFLKALYEDFKAHGAQAVKACREEKPSAYISAIAKVIPKQIDVHPSDALADLADGLSAVAAFLGEVAAEASGPGHEGLGADGPVLPPDARPTAH